MTKDEQRARAVSRLFHTSVDDCKSSLHGYNDPHILCDLLIKCHEEGHVSRERLVRQRIAALVTGK